MRSAEEEHSDDDVIFDESPVNDDNRDKEKQQVDRDINATSLTDLPIELLRLIVEPLELKERSRLARCSRALQEAVATSKWSCFGDDRIGVTVISRGPGVEEFTINFCGFPRLQAKQYVDSLAKCCSSSGIQAKNEEVACTNRCVMIGGRVIRYLNHLCEKLHLEELRLKNVPIDHNHLRLFNEFLDSSCTFDNMSIALHRPGQITERQAFRMKALMARARKEVSIELIQMVLTTDEMLSIECPVAFFIFNPIFGPYPSLPEDVFTKLVRKGHSLFGFTTVFSSLEALNNIIEMVSSSCNRQLVEIPNVDFIQCERYVLKMGDAKDPHISALLTEWRRGRAPPRYRIMSETFEHLGATIFQEPYGEFKIVVQSKNYRQRPITRKP